MTKLRFKEGETVSFRVRADTNDHVHVHGYDLMKDVEPGKTITFSFPATITGIFEVELEDAGEEIAQLRVDPTDPDSPVVVREQTLDPRDDPRARAGSHKVVTKSRSPLDSAPSLGAGRLSPLATAPGAPARARKIGWRTFPCPSPCPTP